MSKMLVTGCAGFIGSRFTRLALDAGHEVVGVDPLTDLPYSSSQKLRNLQSISSSKKFTFLQEDMVGMLPNAVPEIDYIVNFAATPGLRSSWKNPLAQIHGNITATQNAIHLASHGTVKKFIHISTSSVYGTVATGTEDSVLEPVSPYGITKRAAEEMVRIQLQNLVPFTILRLFSVYGPGQRPDMAYSRIIDSLLTGKPFTVFGTGEQMRSNTYVDDVCAAIFQAIEAPEAEGETLNIGGGERKSLNEAIQILESISGVKIVRKQGKVVRGDQIDTQADISKAQNKIGFIPKTSLKNGLEAQWQAMFQARAKG